MMTNEEQVDSIHEAMNRAIDKATPDDLKPFTIKASARDLIKASAICEKHGVTLGSFLRECVTLLVDEYHPPKN